MRTNHIVENASRFTTALCILLVLALPNPCQAKPRSLGWGIASTVGAAVCAGLTVYFIADYSLKDGIANANSGTEKGGANNYWWKGSDGRYYNETGMNARRSADNDVWGGIAAGCLTLSTTLSAIKNFSPEQQQAVKKQKVGGQGYDMEEEALPGKTSKTKASPARKAGKAKADPDDWEDAPAKKPGLEDGEDTDDGVSEPKTKTKPKKKRFEEDDWDDQGSLFYYEEGRVLASIPAMRFDPVKKGLELSLLNARF